jgi:hypothetical protein
MSKTFNRSWTVYGSNKTVATPGSTTVQKKSQAFAYSTTVSGGLNPNYKLNIARGSSATTQLTVDAQELSVSPGFISASLNTDPTHRTDYVFDGVFPFDPPSFGSGVYNANAEADAVRSLYRQIRAQHTQALGGVFAGEIRQTVNLIMSPLKSISKITQAYGTAQRRVISAAAKSKRKRDLTNSVGGQVQVGSSTKKKLADNYLKWTFGVVPLMNDISDIAKIIQRTISDPPRTRFTAHGSAASSQETVLAPVSFGALRCSRRNVDRAITTVKYYGAFRAMDNATVEGVLPRLGKIQQLSGFTLRDFVPTVWNLIPYSFVADYFLNIGDVLEAITTDTSGIAWIARTQVIEQSRQHLVSPDLGLSKAAGQPQWVWNSFSGSQGGYVATRRAISRLTATVPIMTLRSKLANNTGRHIANLFALAVSRF